MGWNIGKGPINTDDLVLLIDGANRKSYDPIYGTSGSTVSTITLPTDNIWDENVAHGINGVLRNPNGYYEFDGSTTYMIYDYEHLQNSITSYTCCWWFRHSGVGTGLNGIINQINGHQRQRILLSTNSNLILDYEATNTTFTVTLNNVYEGSYSISEWNFYSVSHSANDTRVFVNDQYVFATSSTASLTTTRDRSSFRELVSGSSASTTFVHSNTSDNFVSWNNPTNGDLRIVRSGGDEQYMYVDIESVFGVTTSNSYILKFEWEILDEIVTSTFPVQIILNSDTDDDLGTSQFSVNLSPVATGSGGNFKRTFTYDGTHKYLIVGQIQGGGRICDYVIRNLRLHAIPEEQEDGLLIGHGAEPINGNNIYHLYGDLSYFSFYKSQLSNEEIMRIYNNTRRDFLQ